MKRKNTTVKIHARRDAVEGVLRDIASFVTNWPYVVRVSTRDGLKAEIMLPRFVFKFRDSYRLDYHTDYNSYIYDGRGEKSNLSLVVTLKEDKREVTAELELAYSGRGEFWLGKTLQEFVDKIGEVLKELSENRPPEILSTSSSKIVDEVDFSDPMSVANFLSKSKMAHSGLHIIPQGGLLETIAELRKNIGERVIYVSGITSDGSKAFKLLMEGTQILAIEYRDGGDTKVVKVDSEESAREALELASKADGTYTINVWVPIGGV